MLDIREYEQSASAMLDLILAHNITKNIQFIYSYYVKAIDTPSKNILNSLISTKIKDTIQIRHDIAAHLQADELFYEAAEQLEWLVKEKNHNYTSLGLLSILYIVITSYSIHYTKLYEYLEAVAENNIKFTLLSEPKLTPLFKRSLAKFNCDAFDFSEDLTKGDFDYQIEGSSLRYIAFKKHCKNAISKSYIQPNPEKTAEWKDKIDSSYNFV